MTFSLPLPPPQAVGILGFWVDPATVGWGQVGGCKSGAHELQATMPTPAPILRLPAGCSSIPRPSISLPCHKPSKLQPNTTTSTPSSSPPSLQLLIPQYTPKSKRSSRQLLRIAHHEGDFQGWSSSPASRRESVGQQRPGGGGPPVSPTAPSPRSSTCPRELSISTNSSSFFFI